MTFLVATGNPKKCAELTRILAPLGFTVLTPHEAGVDLSDVEETGLAFAENARIKAEAAMQRSGLPSIADDSGLAVDALHGAPGIYSARYAGPDASDADRIDKLLFAMKDVPEGKRQARFVCAVCCVFPDREPITVEKTCEGSIAFSPTQGGGFGYDPVFMVGDRCFSQLTPEQKDEISHRGQALRALARTLDDIQTEKGDNI